MRSRALPTCVMLLALCTASCATQDEGKKDAAFQQAYDAIMKDVAPVKEKGKEQSLPSGVEEALLPKVDLSADNGAVNTGTAVEPTIDFVMSEGGSVPARDLLLSLVSDSGYTMVVHPDIKEEVSLSLSLSNITVPEAVNTVCEMYEFDCRFQAEKKRFSVFPRRLSSRTFKVDNLPVRRTGRSQTKVNSGQASTSTQTSSTASSATTTSQDAGSDVVTDYTADFWEDLDNSLRALLGMDIQKSGTKEIDPSTGRLKVTNMPTGVSKKVRERTTQKSGDTTTSEITDTKVDPDSIVNSEEAQADNGKRVYINQQAGLITVRGLPDELREVESYLMKLQERNSRQVILEAKIVEVELNDGFEYGIDWMNMGRGVGESYPMMSEPNDGTTFVSNPYTQYVPIVANGEVTYDEQSVNDLATDSWQSILSVAQTGDPFSLALRSHDFIGFFKLLQSQGKVQVLSSPRVSVTNNQKALIKVGEEEIFITDVAVENTEFGLTIDPQFETYFSGVSLDVTPQISEDGMVTLHIHPIVAEVTDKVKTYSFGSDTQTYPLAFRKAREADSVVRVQDGQVVVIGGLMKKEESSADYKLPVVGSIPVLGDLLSQKKKDWVKSELVILLRPTVVASNKVWIKEVTDTGERIKGMESLPSTWWAGEGTSSSTKEKTP